MSKANKRCLHCHDPIPIYSDDRSFADGTKSSLAGKLAGSRWMRTNDPRQYFCRMRCAALYGINSAYRESK